MVADAAISSPKIATNLFTTLLFCIVYSVTKFLLHSKAQSNSEVTSLSTTAPLSKFDFPDEEYTVFKVLRQNENRCLD